MTPPPRPSPGSRPIETVGIVAKTRLRQAVQVVDEVSAWLVERGIGVTVETETATLTTNRGHPTCSRDALPAQVDLVLVLGGDGTLLGVAGRVATVDVQVPILAVNFGSLGFLTEITLPELYGSLESVLDGTAGIDERMMLRSWILRSGETIAERVVLNDIVVGKAAQSNIIEYAITVGEQFVTSCRADGVIIASPTGSTAYNLAAGGPIVHPRVDALLLTPIAPHTLTNRPIVIPSDTPVCITPDLSGPHQVAHASFDGQFGVELRSGDVVTVERAPHPLRVVRASARSYFDVLREKLKWGER